MIRSLIIFALLVLSPKFYAQQNQSGPSGGACVGCPATLDGNASLGLVYQRDTCGLNYVAYSQKLGQRFTPAGAPQPVTIAVSGLPACMIVERAFVWCDASGTGVPITISVTNPSAATTNHNMSLVGSDQDKCWGYAGTHTYRTDISSAISGNGNYVFSGFPTGATDDVDGMLFMIVYRDPSATYQGHMTIYDGAVVIAGGTTTQTMTNLSICANSTNQRAFMTVADLQGLGAQLSMNGSAPFTITEDWWNFIDQPTTTLTTAQTTSAFNVNSGSDCFNFCMMGLYYQTTTCVTCTPTGQAALVVNTNATGTCFPNSGTATASVTGGTPPYTYVWQPGNFNTATVTGLAPGSYTVNVVDATGCNVGTDTVIVPQGTFPTAQFATTPTQQAFYPGQICMTDLTVGGAQWIWSINGVPVDSTNDYCYTLPDTGTYCITLLVADSIGCPDTAQTCIEVLGDATISIPNIFTPNGDGTNDFFEVTWTGLTGLRCEIFDRWGVLVYEWDGLQGKWNGIANNGKMCTDGVYYYIITATTIQSEVHKFTGFVHLASGN
jgi:gliding motility-associated-like protein